jgi:uncharacterized protein (TIGR02271 family)
MKTHVVILVAALAVTGCSTSRPTRRVVTTPIEIQGPINVTGPVTVTTPIAPETAAKLPTSTPVQSWNLPAPSGVAAPAAQSVVTSTSRVGVSGEELELKKEDLRVGIEEVGNGSAVIRKVVTTETVNIPVKLTREDFTVERVAADGPPTTPWGEGELVISIPLTRQEARPVITPRVYERVNVRKVTTTENRNVSGNVRTETVGIEKRIQ